jgi:hydrogenase nickel incorporation protein HypA/HybF
MHELAITRNIVAIVSEAAGDHRVRCVTLDVGRLSGVMPDAIAFCFEAAAEGTVLEGARLEIRLIDGRGQCEDCGSEFSTETIFAPCPCGSRRVVRLAGEELMVKTMELEEAA